MQGLLNDREIQRLASLGMITPFEEKLVRVVDEKKVISFGASSYGYDMRLSPKQFMVFRHVPGKIVDPKNFTPETLEVVDLQEDDHGKFFVLPAHSYGLGVAMESLKIPPDITALFIGKSTYARCFSGDTKVKLVDGEYTFLELIDRASKGETLWGYGVKDGEIVVQQLVHPRYIETSELIEVLLDNDIPIRCTADHVFLLKDGSRKQAQELLAGDSLHAIYDCHSHGYPSIYDPVLAASLGNDDRTRSLKVVHRMVAEKVFGKTDLHIHHKDGNRFNNHPNNLELLSKQEHARLHNEEDGRYLMGGQKFARLYKENEAFRSHISKHFHSDESKAKANANARWWKESEENKAHLDAIREQRWGDPESRRRQSEVAKRGMAARKRRDDVTEESLKQALIKTGTIRGAAKLLNVDRTAFRRMKHIIDAFKEGSLMSNHKVKSVKKIEGIHPTFCLTAPETGNFALAAGVFVNNCGIIANLTPGEAGWEGYLTIEISNASGADCRVYAEEGIVQALFFRGQPCLTSYQDRKGKYQSQKHEVVLAKV